MHELIDFLFHIANVTANLLYILSLLVATPSVKKKNPILGLNLDSGFFLTEGVYVK
jgi:hypothetical protein